MGDGEDGDGDGEDGDGNDRIVLGVMVSTGVVMWAMRMRVVVGVMRIRMGALGW